MGRWRHLKWNPDVKFFGAKKHGVAGNTGGGNNMAPVSLTIEQITLLAPEPRSGRPTTHLYGGNSENTRGHTT
jgi:hypothetical protein